MHLQFVIFLHFEANRLLLLFFAGDALLRVRRLSLSCLIDEAPVTWRLLAAATTDGCCSRAKNSNESVTAKSSPILGVNKLRPSPRLFQASASRPHVVPETEVYHQNLRSKGKLQIGTLWGFVSVHLPNHCAHVLTPSIFSRVEIAPHDVRVLCMVGYRE